VPDPVTPDPEDAHVDYPPSELRERDVDRDPFVQFRRWFDDAIAAGEPDPWAMALATATRDAVPAVRMVYLRGVDARGFVFYTHYASRKGEELAANPQASLVWFWARPHRSVRAEGAVERTSELESDAYFRARPRGSRIGAWASPQSQRLENRDELERRVARFERRFPDEVPRPPFWGGFRLSPRSIEFWQGRPSRLHDRLRFRRVEDGGWTIERLAP